MGLAPKMSPNQPRGQILRRFPEPSAKRPPWPKSRVLFGLGIWGGCAGIPALIRLIRGVLEAPQHGTHCPQAPWPEEQRWLKRKRLSAHPKKSCRLDCVVPLHKVSKKVTLRNTIPHRRASWPAKCSDHISCTGYSFNLR